MSLRTIEWYEERHFQMAAKLSNYRRNLRQLQRAHDRELLFAQRAHQLRMEATVEWSRARARIRQLEAQLAAAGTGRAGDRSGGADWPDLVLMVLVGMALVGTVVFVASWLWGR